MTPEQLRLLTELDPWQILGLAVDPKGACADIRDRHGANTPRDEQWYAASVTRATYRWGIAITAYGDYMRERGVRDPQHAVTLTWAQLTAWSVALTDEQRERARQALTATRDEQRALVAELVAVASHDAEPTLF
ncbi:hypothetical protein [Rhodococcus pyridinivorans]|uniref:Uncharacterized protein n=1 Tax=Rhodococcus pyridinivorans AK37 TaxID=1114960 RepID=H0JL69_9NOCA|nr:hypothetical protein [Rhodococcus pyridinivorans]EHK86404.1 hypothetical protein AK37_01612 [Rhodococcus pyridinivorans AK37]MCD2139505.1 hypothetical protein [Rhodococcus pyridinivorans]